MYVAGCHNQFVILLAQRDNFFVDRNQVILRLHRGCFRVFDHKAVVSKRLYLIVVIKFTQAVNLVSGFPTQDRLVEFPRLAGGTHNQPLPVLF